MRIALIPETAIRHIGELHVGPMMMTVIAEQRNSALIVINIKRVMYYITHICIYNLIQLQVDIKVNFWLKAQQRVLPVFAHDIRRVAIVLKT